jgi:hypothetical protein
MPGFFHTMSPTARVRAVVTTSAVGDRHEFDAELKVEVQAGPPDRISPSNLRQQQGRAVRPTFAEFCA